VQGGWLYSSGDVVAQNVFIASGNQSGMSTTITYKDGSGNNHTLTFTGGILTGTA
jgi:hypothetical protein